MPLLIVVPYAAFRSLAAEREDGTYELLSITTLTARQIVLGKLGSAILQMMVYYSALAPCIAFTYLLRGIDIITIGLFLTYTFLASLLLSIFGLMMATVTQARHWQVLPQRRVRDGPARLHVRLGHARSSASWPAANRCRSTTPISGSPTSASSASICPLARSCLLHRRGADHVRQREPLDADPRGPGRAAVAARRLDDLSSGSASSQEEMLVRLVSASPASTG